jgi:putative ABC transport system permease protein
LRVALVLAVIGIYGLMAYSVEQRTQEMGIRMALGADRITIRNLVVWHGMRLAIVGVALGIAAALGLTRLIASLLFGVKSWDPAVFISVPLMPSAVALLAVWLPATHALEARFNAGVAHGVIWKRLRITRNPRRTKQSR